MLAIVVGHLIIRVQSLSLVDRLSHVVDVSAIVDRADEVVDDLKKPRRVLAEIQTLSWCRVNVPVKVLQIVSFLGFDHIKQEVETNLTATETLCVLVTPKIKHLEMVQVRLLLTVQDVNAHVGRRRREKISF